MTFRAFIAGDCRGTAAAVLTAALLVVGAPGSARAQGTQVDQLQISALVDALKGRPLTAEQHDALVDLGELVATSDEAIPGDLIYTGWALVAADRPALGYPLIKQGLSFQPMQVTDVRRSLALAVELGQDALGRSIVELASGVNPKTAERLARSVDQPVLLDAALRRVRRSSLRGLQVEQWDQTQADRISSLVTWWVAPIGPTEGLEAVLLVPDSGNLDRLPHDCQSAARLTEAMQVAAEGRIAVLPGLRGCDFSDGLYLGVEHAAVDLAMVVERLRVDLKPGRIVAVGEGAAAHLLLELQRDGALDVDEVRATDPLDPADLVHLPEELRAPRAVQPAPSAR